MHQHYLEILLEDPVLRHTLRDSDLVGLQWAKQYGFVTVALSASETVTQPHIWRSTKCQVQRSRFSSGFLSPCAVSQHISETVNSYYRCHRKQQEQRLLKEESVSMNAALIFLIHHIFLWVKKEKEKISF